MTSRRWIPFRILALALVLFGSGCWRTSTVDHDAPCAAASTDRDAFLGLVGIFARVTQDVVWAGTHAAAERGAFPIDLTDSVEFVRCIPKGARQRAGRQRYAVTKLAAGAAILRHRHRDQDAAVYVQQLDRLKVDGVLLALLNDRLHESPELDLGPLEGEAGKIIDANDSLKDFQRSCCPCIENCTVGQSSNGTSGVAFKVTVQRTPSEIACMVDPRVWKTLVPAHFKDVVRLKEPACTAGSDPSCRGTREPCPPSSQPVQPDPNPPAPGSNWCGIVDEKFQAHVGAIDSTLDNLLKVRLDSKPDDVSTPDTDEATATMNYGLCESINYAVGSDSGQCGVQEDCGVALIDTTGISGWSRFEGVKRVRFDKLLDYDLNAWAPLVLEVLVKESALATCRAACSSDSAPPVGDSPCSCTVVDFCQQTSQPYIPDQPTLYCPS